MNKFSKLVVAAGLCSVLGTSLVAQADPLASPISVFNNPGYEASITDLGGADYQGHNNGATLHLNKAQQNYVIKWHQLNIPSGKFINFNANQSNYTALNKVSSGLSKFAGTMTGNCRVIVSNPNGIMVENGAFINTNSLMLTTHDANIVGSQVQLERGNSSAGVVIGNATLSVNKDLAVASSGIVLNGADIFAGGNISLVTSDGAGFTAQADSDTIAYNSSLNTNGVKAKKVVYGDGSKSSSRILVKNSSVANTSMMTADGKIVMMALDDAGLVSVKSAITNNGGIKIDGNKIVLTQKLESTNGNIDLDANTQIKTKNLLAKEDITLNANNINTKTINSNLGSVTLMSEDKTSGQISVKNVTAQEKVDIRSGSVTAKSVTSKDSYIYIAANDVTSTGTIRAQKDIPLSNGKTKYSLTIDTKGTVDLNNISSGGGVGINAKDLIKVSGAIDTEGEVQLTTSGDVEINSLTSNHGVGITAQGDMTATGDIEVTGDVAEGKGVIAMLIGGDIVLQNLKASDGIGIGGWNQLFPNTYAGPLYLSRPDSITVGNVDAVNDISFTTVGDFISTGKLTAGTEISLKTQNIDVAGNISAAAGNVEILSNDAEAKTQNVKVGGLLSAGNDVKMIISKKVELNGVSAANQVDITAKDSDSLISVNQIDANGDIKLNSGNSISTSGILNSKMGAVDLVAKNEIYVKGVDAKGDITSSSAEFETDGLLKSGAGVDIDADDYVDINSIQAVDEVDIATLPTSTAGEIDVKSVTTAGAISLTGGNSVSAGSLTSTNDSIIVKAKDMNVVNASGFDDTKFFGENFTSTGRISAGDYLNINLTGGGIDVNEAYAGGLLGFGATTQIKVADGESATNRLELTTPGDIQVGTLKAAGSIGLTSGSNVTATGKLHSTGANVFSHASGDINVQDVEAKQSVGLGNNFTTAISNPTDNITAGNIKSGSGSLQVGNDKYSTLLLAQDKVTVNGSIAAVDQVLIEGKNGLTVTDNITSSSKTTLNAENGTVSIKGATATGDIVVDSDGLISTGKLNSIAGNVDAVVRGDASMNQVFAQDSFKVVAMGDVGVIDADTVDGNIELTTSGDITVGELDTNKKIVLYSGNDITATGEMTSVGDDVELKASGDINIEDVSAGGAAKIGNTGNFTKTTSVSDISVAMNQTDNITIGSVDAKGSSILSSQQSIVSTGANGISSDQRLYLKSKTINISNDLNSADGAVIAEATDLLKARNVNGHGVSLHSTHGKVDVNDVTSEQYSLMLSAQEVEANNLIATDSSVSIIGKEKVDVGNVDSQKSLVTIQGGDIETNDVHANNSVTLTDYYNEGDEGVIKTNKVTADNSFIQVLGKEFTATGDIKADNSYVLIENDNGQNMEKVSAKNISADSLVRINADGDVSASGIVADAVELYGEDIVATGDLKSRVGDISVDADKLNAKNIVAASNLDVNGADDTVITTLEDISASAVLADGSVTLNARDFNIINNVSSTAGDVVIKATTINAKDVSAAKDINLSTSFNGDVNVRDIEAENGGVVIYGNKITAREVTANSGKVKIKAKDNILAGNILSVGDEASVETIDSKNIHIFTIKGDDVELVAKDVSVVGDVTSENGDVLIEADSVTAHNIIASDNLEVETDGLTTLTARNEILADEINSVKSLALEANNIKVGNGSGDIASGGKLDIDVAQKLYAGDLSGVSGVEVNAAAVKVADITSSAGAITVVANSINADDVSADDAVTIRGTDVSVEDIDSSDGDISLTASNDLSASSVSSVDGGVAVLANNIDIENDVNSMNSGVKLEAFNNISVDDVNAGGHATLMAGYAGNVIVGPGTIDAGDIKAGGDAVVVSVGDLAAKDIDGHNVAVASAEGAVEVQDVNAGGDAFLLSLDGINSGGVTASNNAIVAATQGDINTNDIQAGNDVNVGSGVVGDIELSSEYVALSAYYNDAVVGEGSINVGDIKAGGKTKVLAPSGSIVTQDIDSAGDVNVVSSNDDVTTGNVVSLASVTLAAQEDLKTGDIHAGDDVLATSLKTINIGDIESDNGQVGVATIDSLVVEDVTSEGDIVLASNDNTHGRLISRSGAVKVIDLNYLLDRFQAFTDLLKGDDVQKNLNGLPQNPASLMNMPVASALGSNIKGFAAATDQDEEERQSILKKIVKTSKGFRILK